MDDMVTAATMLEESADVIDLNFGCPAPKVTNICAGAALMGEPQKLVTMVENIVDAVNVPVTAKMRLGTGKVQTMLSTFVNLSKSRSTTPVHSWANIATTILRYR